MQMDGRTEFQNVANVLKKGTCNIVEFTLLRNIKSYDLNGHSEGIFF